jgi:hypothetical protein
MIHQYIWELEQIIQSREEIIDIEVIRHNLWETEFETIVLYRYKLLLEDNSIIELTERLIEQNNQLNRTKYSYHWQTQNGELIKRWDNAPHHPEIETTPHHLHTKKGVLPHNEIDGLEALKRILEEFSD